MTLLDRGPTPHSDASSTDISKMIRMDYGSDVFYHELAELALDGWERWNVDWPRPLYHDEGFLVLAAGPMRPGGFEFESRRVLVERGYAAERLGRDDINRRWPLWNSDRYPDGYLSPRGGWAESGAVVEQLLHLCAERGVRSVTGTMSSVVSDGSSVRGVYASPTNDPSATPEVIHGDVVVVTAGAWTPVLVPELATSLQAVAQPVVHFGVDDPDQYRGPAFPPFAADIAGTGWYGFPALSDGRVKLGHHGDGLPVHPDHRGEVGEAHIARARSFLRESIPSLADAPVVGTRICLYCDSFDGDLLIDRDPDRTGLVVAAGGSGHGFKFAPVIGKLVADAAEGGQNRWSDRFQWRTGGTARTEEARHVSEKDDLK